MSLRKSIFVASTASYPCACIFPGRCTQQVAAPNGLCAWRAQNDHRFHERDAFPLHKVKCFPLELLGSFVVKLIVR